MNQNKAWMISLIVIGICALLVYARVMTGISMPVVLKGILCVALLIALPVLGYTTEKVATRMEE